MAESILTPTQVKTRTEDRNEVEATVSWPVWCSAIAVTSAVVGLYCDISWHISIGRDTFWTPAHIAIYFCGVLAAVSCGYLILFTTFAGSRETKERSVGIWGFRGPFGAFIAAWGGIAMLVSAPFDDWWHNAYGLDVKILSPPHVVLITGIITVGLGSLILILGRMNLARGPARDRLNRFFLYVGAMILILLSLLFYQYSSRALMHSAVFYRTVMIWAPIALAGVAGASGRRWAATTVAGIYSLYWLAGLWIFPFFPAEPKLGPVYQQITHFKPLDFPLLLIVPAVAMDLLRASMSGRNKWLQAAVSGAAFLAILVAIHWPFANLLMSSAARNWFFGAHYFAYFQPPDDDEVRNVFFAWESTRAEFWQGMGVALLAAALSTRLGLAWGDWMKQVRR